MTTYYFFSHLTTHQHNVIKSQTFKRPSRHPPIPNSLPIKYLPNDPQTTENMLQIKNHSQILKTAPKTGQNRLQPVSQKPVKASYNQSANCWQQQNPTVKSTIWKCAHTAMSYTTKVCPICWTAELHMPGFKINVKPFVSAQDNTI